MINVLLLCTTNFVRSPLFEALLTQLAGEGTLNQHIRFVSRGTYAGETSRPVERRIRERALRHGLDLSGHMTAKLSVKECLDANTIICLDEDSYWYVRRELPALAISHIRLATEYGDNLGVREVPEPVTGEGSFEEVEALALKLCPLILSRLRKEYAF